MNMDRDSSDSLRMQALAQALAQIGCPTEKCDLLASQLDKRAKQLSEMKGRSYEDAIRHLMSLMQQGWVANDHSNHHQN